MATIACDRIYISAYNNLENNHPHRHSKAVFWASLTNKLFVVQLVLSVVAITASIVIKHA